MKRRKLGSRGPELSILGFGCMRLPTSGEKINRDEATAMFNMAIDAGVDYLDTAWPYHEGESEKIIGDVFKGSRRDSVKIADKMPTWLVKSHADLDKFFSQQLKRLKTDYIDVYLLHSLDAAKWKTMLEIGAIDWLAKKKERGDIAYAGFSFHDHYASFETILNAWEWDVCQIQYNFLDVKEQAGVRGLRLAYEKNIGVIIMEPLLGGNLVKAPKAVEALWARSAHPEWTPVERALRWLWDQKEVGAVLSGMSSVVHVRENLKIASAASMGELSDDEKLLYDEALTVYKELKAVGCTGCGYCKHCPHGVDIPWNFKLINRGIMYGNPDSARDEYKGMLKSFEKGLLPSDPRALNCISCGECEPKCPQKLEIGRLMPEAAALLGAQKSFDEAGL